MKNKDHKNSREKIRKLKLLLEFGKKVAAERNLDSLLALLANEVKTLLTADRSTIFVLNKEKKILWSKVAQGTQEVITIAEDKGIAGETVQKKKLLNIKDAYRDSRFNPEVDRAIGYMTHSILSAPMQNIQGEVVGVFQVLNKKSKKPFNAGDEEILIVLASQAGIAVENAQLYEQIRHATEETIFRLAAAAEYKDKDTAAHIKRMSLYSALIAEGLGYSKEYCVKIQLASPMHDIGKLGVPDAILMKPGKLDEKEWAEMKKHTLYGSEILKNSESELIQMSQSIALSHHEKYDGSGYPKGLKGKKIPLEGRIVALADVFDALTSKRVYKENFSLEAALKIVREGAGKHFDPKILQAFETVLSKITMVMNRFAEKPETVQTGEQSSTRAKEISGV